MSKDKLGIGSIKILICVCMYNESKNAINLTLNGIYDNLPNLEKEGISPEEIAVVLMQDGIHPGEVEGKEAARSSAVGRA